ncbi:MAG: NTP transferase domain-containing protein [Deltaproteobacteria bacterium]|nr:NTP transferase domain-containing protein [Deltaproteobacteria bacterium]
MRDGKKAASIIFAAGRGSRMKGYEGNKTLLPLVPGESSYEGKCPILLHIIDNLPSGPKAVVINHRKGDITRLTGHLGISYCEQPELNGTGGALIAASKFIKSVDIDRFIITMGDIPLVKSTTYHRLLDTLDRFSMSVLGFHPEDRKQYGMLEIDGEKVNRIIEWKYWKDYPEEPFKNLEICNSGIYAVKRDCLLKYLDILENRPHLVTKEINNAFVTVPEYFITDLVELMRENGHSTGYIIAENEHEVMGIDDLAALKKAQNIYKMGV